MTYKRNGSPITEGSLLIKFILFNKSQNKEITGNHKSRQKNKRIQKKENSKRILN